MKNVFFLLLLTALTFTSCADDDDNSGACTNFQVGDSIDVPGTSESLFIDAVYQDNRCSCGLACIIGGGVGYRLLTPANDTLLIGFGDNSVPADTVYYNGQLLRLVNITHREICEFSDLGQSDYCADFVFE